MGKPMMRIGKNYYLCGSNLASNTKQQTIILTKNSDNYEQETTL